MKAVRYYQPGGPDVLTYEDAPDPVAGAGQVLLRVRAAGVNYADVMQREGGGRGDPPWTPGLEVCGEVVAATGPWQAGQRVFGRVPGGGYAELVAAQADTLYPAPDSLSDAEAGAANVGFITAWHALTTRAHLQPGETVLVQAGGSGIGSSAIQLAKVLGARVIATAGSPEKLAQAHEIGADETVSYRDGSWAQKVRELTGHRGVDVIVEGVGESTFAGSLAALAPRGRLVCFGGPSGADLHLNLWDIIRNCVEIHGFAMADPAEHARSVPSFREQVLPLLASGKVKPVIDRSLPLSKAGEAQQLLSDRAVFGKLVLIP
jgi:NADPH:quinone reductase-like Zn-dependent oxidoreductase